QYTGVALLLHVRHDGEEFLKRYPITTNGIGSSDVSWPIAGDLVGANGNTVWIRYGNTLSAASIVHQELVAILAHGLRDPIVTQQVDGNGIYVLTEAGLYRFSIAVRDIPSVQQDMFVALPDQLGFHIDGDQLVTW